MDLGWCLGGHYYLLGQVCTQGRETDLVRGPMGKRCVNCCLREMFYGHRKKGSIVRSAGKNGKVGYNLDGGLTVPMRCLCPNSMTIVTVVAKERRN